MNDKRKRNIAIVVLGLVLVAALINAIEFSPVEIFMKMHGF